MIIKSLKEKYDLALNNFIDKAKKDKHIIAIFLCGSMYEKTLWDKSDIDLLIITDLEVSNHPNPLVENDICFDISVYSRLNFKKALEKSLPDSLLYNKFSNSKLLYSNDDSIKKYHEKFGSIGSIDKEAMLLRYFSTILAMKYKAEKSLFVNEDIFGCFYYIITFIVENISKLIIILNDAEITYESNAMELASTYAKILMNLIYFDLISNKIDKKKLKEALKAIDQYLIQITNIVYEPVIDYMLEENEIRSESELDLYFSHIKFINYEWLVTQGIFNKLDSPICLTKKSNVELNEAAYILAK